MSRSWRLYLSIAGRPPRINLLRNLDVASQYLSDRGNLVQVTRMGAKTLGLLRQKRCVTNDEYVAIKYHTDDEHGRSDLVNVLSFSEAPCANSDVVETIIEI